MLLIIDARYQSFDMVRRWVGVVATPIYWLAGLPTQFINLTEELVYTRSTLIVKTSELEKENLILKEKIQQLIIAQDENIHLRKLLNASQKITQPLKLATIIGIDPDPKNDVIMLDKGSLDGVYLGQAIIDSQGIVGQVIEVNAVSSRVRLLTSNLSRIPIINQRTGYRAVLAGDSSNNMMYALHIPKTIDFKKGDLLIASGLGKIFPIGYPVGIVTYIQNDTGKTFSTFEVKPLSFFEKNRFVLILLTKKTK